MWVGTRRQPRRLRAPRDPLAVSPGPAWAPRPRPGARLRRRPRRRDVHLSHDLRSSVGLAGRVRLRLLVVRRGVRPRIYIPAPDGGHAADPAPGARARGLGAAQPGAGLPRWATGSPQSVRLGVVMAQALVMPALAVVTAAHLYNGLRQLLFAAPAAALLSRGDCVACCWRLPVAPVPCGCSRSPARSPSSCRRVVQARSFPYNYTYQSVIFDAVAVAVTQRLLAHELPRARRRGAEGRVRRVLRLHRSAGLHDALPAHRRTIAGPSAAGTAGPTRSARSLPTRRPTRSTSSRRWNRRSSP